MKAMVLKKTKPVNKNPLDFEDVPMPVLGPGELLIKVSTCGVCHTDLHTVEGDLELPRLPVVPGHQVVGTVNGLGEGVTGYKKGDRVGVAWLNSACGECDFCERGLENLCEDAMFTGLNVDGGYAEYMVVSEGFAYPIPDGVPDLEAAPLLCAGVIGYRSLKLSGIGAGQKLGLFGFGASAHVTIQLAKYWGCEVYVFTRSKVHRQHAKELGAVWIGSSKDPIPEQMDACITFAPVGSIVLDALKVLRKGGTVAINAIYMSPIPKIRYDYIYDERSIRTVTNLTREDAQEFLGQAAQIPIKTDVERYKLEDANIVLKKMKNAEIRGAAVLEIG
jgi:propanol-preferring alcohol dehydrogenase